MNSRRSVKILARTKTEVKLLLRVKELSDGSILLSLPGLDGRLRSVLHSEDVRRIPDGGEMRIRYDEAQPVSAEVDHLTLHSGGHHVITGPTEETGRSKHWGRLVQPPPTRDTFSSVLATVIPAAIERFPKYKAVPDSTRDTEIDLPRLGIDHVYFRIFVFPKAGEDGLVRYAIPESQVDPSVRDQRKLFKGLDWFTVPLTASTLVFALFAGHEPYPPRTIVIRDEGPVGGQVHHAYFE
jgi:hypothetical protein